MCLNCQTNYRTKEFYLFLHSIFPIICYIGHISPKSAFSPVKREVTIDANCRVMLKT